MVRRFSADWEQYVDDTPTIPLDAQPLPQDWEWQVLAEWMAVTAVTQGESYAPPTATKALPCGWKRPRSPAR